MGRFLALIGGFLVSLGMFAFGLGFATWLLMAEPVQRLDPSVDVAGLWTGQPRRIDTKVQDFERLPGPADHRDAKPSGGRRTVPAATQAADDPASGVDDTVVTSAVRNAPGEEPRAAATVDAHIDWCAARYRSYRRSDDTYQPYRGGRRPCVSPYFGDPETAEERAPPPAPDSVIYAADADNSASVEYLSADALGSGAVTPEHAAYCFSRYRSYRPEDNTYQPYGGGPRRECR